MGRQKVAAPKIFSTNKDLRFTMVFKFFKYDRDVVYDIRNDRAANYNAGSGVASVASSLGGVAGGLAGFGMGSGVGDPIGGAQAGSNIARDNVRDMLTNGGARQNDLVRQRRTELLRSPESIIELPIPANLVDKFQIQYENSQLNLLGKTILDLWVKGARLDNLGEASDRLITEALDNMQQTLPQSLSAAITAGRGKVKNPVYAVIFKGIEVREHQFSWRIIPESPEEQNGIKEIFRRLKKHSLPAFERAGEIDLLSYPDFCMVQITPELYSFPKPCFISNLSFSYAPDGIPAFYNDDTAAGYELNMTLIETTAISRDDYPELEA